MRRRWIIPTALAATAAVALAPAAGAPAKDRNAIKLSCTLELTAQGPPQPPPAANVSFGLVSCPSPFGNGVHYGSAIATPTSPGQGTIAVDFKNYYDRGTTSGSVVGTFSATSPTDIRYEGTVTYTGGTGKFRRIQGGGTIRCTSSDGGSHKSCRVDSKLTGV
jgi:hypothetical protein